MLEFFSEPLSQTFMIHALLAGEAPPESVAADEVNVTQARSRAMHREIMALHSAILCGSMLGQIFEGEVVHVIAGRLTDLTPLLEALPVGSRDFH